MMCIYDVQCSTSLLKILDQTEGVARGEDIHEDEVRSLGLKCSLLFVTRVRVTINPWLTCSRGHMQMMENRVIFLVTFIYIMVLREIGANIASSRFL